MATKKGKKSKTGSKSGTTTIAFVSNAVWTGSIARLRVHDSQSSTGNVFAYKAPGTNSDNVGTTTDPNMIKALFLARDNGRSVTGFTNASNRIVWLDY